MLAVVAGGSAVGVEKLRSEKKIVRIVDIETMKKQATINSLMVLPAMLMTDHQQGGGRAKGREGGDRPNAALMMLGGGDIMLFALRRS